MKHWGNLNDFVKVNIIGSFKKLESGSLTFQNQRQAAEPARNLGPTIDQPAGRPANHPAESDGAAATPKV